MYCSTDATKAVNDLEHGIISCVEGGCLRLQSASDTTIARIPTLPRNLPNPTQVL